MAVLDRLGSQAGGGWRAGHHCQPGAILWNPFGMGSQEWRLSRFVRLASQALMGASVSAAMELGLEVYQYFMVQGMYSENLKLGHAFNPNHREDTGRKPKSSALDLQEQVLAIARKSLKTGGFKHASGRPNVRALAAECEAAGIESGRLIGFDRARQIIADAIKSGDLK